VTRDSSAPLPAAVCSPLTAHRSPLTALTLRNPAVIRRC